MIQIEWERKMAQIAWGGKNGTSGMRGKMAQVELEEKWHK